MGRGEDLGSVPKKYSHSKKSARLGKRETPESKGHHLPKKNGANQPEGRGKKLASFLRKNYPRLPTG